VGKEPPAQPAHPNPDKRPFPADMNVGIKRDKALASVSLLY